jgi:hypothetical protein
MTEYVEQVQVKATGTQKTEYIVYYLLGALELLLLFRLVLKILGAGTASIFVRIIYSISSIFIMPFEGIFQRGVAEGIETAAVFEPATVMAILVYALLVWGIVKLIRISSGEQQQE